MNNSTSSQQGKALPPRSALPLPDYDHLPTASLAHRIRTLDAEGLTTLLNHERNHGNRGPVISVLELRLGELHAGEEPTAGSPDSFVPEKSPGPRVPRSI